MNTINNMEQNQNLLELIQNLENRVKTLEEKYEGILLDIKNLEYENISTSNEIYRMENSLDARIDILAEYCRIEPDV